MGQQKKDGRIEEWPEDGQEGHLLRWVHIELCVLLVNYTGYHKSRKIWECFKVEGLSVFGLG